MIGTFFRGHGCHCWLCHAPCSSARISRGQGSGSVRAPSASPAYTGHSTTSGPCGRWTPRALGQAPLLSCRSKRHVHTHGSFPVLALFVCPLHKLFVAYTPGNKPGTEVAWGAFVNCKAALLLRDRAPPISKCALVATMETVPAKTTKSREGTWRLPSEVACASQWFGRPEVESHIRNQRGRTRFSSCERHADDLSAELIGEAGLVQDLHRHISVTALLVINVATVNKKHCTVLHPNGKRRGVEIHSFTTGRMSKILTNPSLKRRRN